MCEVCNSKVSRFGMNVTNGTYAYLGDNVGNIYINEFLIFESEDNKETIIPAAAFNIQYKDKTVYSFRQHINFCPFCGRKLEEV